MDKIVWFLILAIVIIIFGVIVYRYFFPNRYYNTYHYHNSYPPHGDSYLPPGCPPCPY